MSMYWRSAWNFLETMAFLRSMSICAMMVAGNMVGEGMECQGKDRLLVNNLEIGEHVHLVERM